MSMASWRRLLIVELEESLILFWYLIRTSSMQKSARREKMGDSLR